MPRKVSPYSRVTTVLDFVNSSWKEYWLKAVGFDEADRIGKETKEFGTHVHKIVEDYLTKVTTEAVYSDREKECANHIINWIKETKAEVVEISGKPSIEFEVIDEKLKLIGHFDALIKINNTLWLVDWKTSSRMKKEFPLQKAAYAKMLENYGLDVNDGVTIRVDRDPKSKKQFEVATYNDIKNKYWPIFKKALEVYKYFSGKTKVL
jgi:predicted RecB family nuclease